MFQIDLNSDLKEEPDLRRRRCFILFESVMPGSRICLNLFKHAPMWGNTLTKKHIKRRQMYRYRVATLGGNAVIENFGKFFIRVISRLKFIKF